MGEILVTRRLALRLMESSDEANLELLDGDPRVRAFFPGGTSARPASRQRIEDSRASYATAGFAELIVEDRVSGEFMGRAGFKQMPDGEVEVGYLFLIPFWGQGFATEALQGLFGWFDAALAPKGRVIAMAPTGHRASRRVMEKCGMTWFKTDAHQGVECVFYELRLPRAAALQP
jgi:[ribosomal protein S5]-alanine N-acetyltransferase